MKGWGPKNPGDVTPWNPRAKGVPHMPRWCHSMNGWVGDPRTLGTWPRGTAGQPKGSQGVQAVLPFIRESTVREGGGRAPHHPSRGFPNKKKL